MPQVLANGLLAAAIFTIIGLGFAVQNRAAGFLDFSLGLSIAAGAYGLYSFKMLIGLPIIPAVILAVLSASLIACLLDLSIYRQLRNRGASGSLLLLASLGVYVVGQNLLSLCFGDNILTVRTEPTVEGFAVWGARITFIQAVTLAAGLFVPLALTAFFKTRFGLEYRATSNDRSLVETVGIRSNRVILLATAIGNALAAFSGALIALDTDMFPAMGLAPLLIGAVVAIVGGLRLVTAITLMALLVGVGQNIVVIAIGSQWQDAFVFGILMIFLLVRGRKVYGGID